MKRLALLVIAMIGLFFTSCKPEPENGDNNGEKVRVSCSISMNKGVRSDFTNLMDEGKVNWSDGRECVYVAIPGDNPTIIELESWADGNPSHLVFSGEAAKGLIQLGDQYELWYFGHSQQLDEPYVRLVDGSRIEGSIARQSGSLEELGYCHIAKTTVTAELDGEEVVLNLNASLVNQMAIALLDLEGVEEIYGSAIKGTEYALAYDEAAGVFELKVTENSDAKIDVQSSEGISYVFMFPNDATESQIRCQREGKTFAYTFHKAIKANKVYFNTAADGITKEALEWTECEGMEDLDVSTTQTITVNGVTFTMIKVENGTFKMGANGAGNNDNEKPVHSVTLSDYYIGETEVTQELWQAVMGSNPSSYIGNQKPVHNLSWTDCQNFVAQLNYLTGKSFRLPTEAEWEFAARGGNKSQGYRYSGSDNIQNVAWASCDYPRNVMTKSPNELGIYDMSGNVMEWCFDWYGAYSSDSQINPIGPISAYQRVIRGGDAIHVYDACRVSYRAYNYPDNRSYSYGLRLAI